jgi:hypothetical protein
MIVRLRHSPAVGRHEVPFGELSGTGTVARFVTVIPVARVGRDKGRKAVTGE